MAARSVDSGHRAMWKTTRPSAVVAIALFLSYRTTPLIHVTLSNACVWGKPNGLKSNLPVRPATRVSQRAREYCSAPAEYELPIRIVVLNNTERLRGEFEHGFSLVRFRVRDAHDAMGYAAELHLRRVSTQRCVAVIAYEPDASGAPRQRPHDPPTRVACRRSPRYC